MDESIINQLERWKLEANSPFNDGWTQKHYRDQIDRVREWLDKHDTTSDCGGV